jgi:methylaspartate ammonia-lyase
VRDRIQKIGQPGYKPTIHLDVYGTIGQAFSNNMQAIIEFLKRLSNAVEPFDLALETPIIAETQEEQLFLFKELRTAIKKEGLNVSLIVDEWCNTFEDIILFAKG